MTQQDTITSVLKSVDRPIWVITSESEESGKAGMIATWVSQASLDPENPRIMAAISPMHHTHQVIQQRLKFVAHLITRDEVELVWRFGLKSGNIVNKFSDYEYLTTDEGLPRLNECHSFLECSVVTQFVAGDRTFFIATIDKGSQLKPEKQLLTE